MLGGLPTAEAASTLCAAGKGVTAVAGRLGTVDEESIVGSAVVVCQDGAPASGAIGSAGSPPGATTCPEEQVAVGIEGRESDYVNYLALRCRAADLSGPTAVVGGYGGTGGAPDGPIDCPEGQQLVGLDGSLYFAGTTVRHLKIVCAAPDRDADGVATANDNCALAANSDQADLDADGRGDACDATDDRPPPPPPVVTERITPNVSASWSVRRGYVLLRRLVVSRIPVGATVTVGCAGEGCPFRSRRLSRSGGGTASATKAFAKRRLRSGAAVAVRVTKPGAIGRLVSFKVSSAKTPTRRVQCLPVGSLLPAATC
jgi:hypothetical protein